MNNGNIDVYYLPTTKCVKTNNFEFGVMDMKWHPSQNQISCATSHGEIHVWNEPVELREKGTVSPTEEVDIHKLLVNLESEEDSKSSFNTNGKIKNLNSIILN